MPIKVMIVDDTITYRTILKNIVEGMPNTEVVATAANGKIALSKLLETPADLVLLDIEMPEMDGLETLQHIKSLYPGMGVVMVSGMNRSSADITIRALEMGALDFIPKPEGDSLKQSSQALQNQLGEVFQHFDTLQRNKKIRTISSISSIIKKPEATSIRTSAVSNPSISAPLPATKPMMTSLRKVDVIAMGSSTGGPGALAELLPLLPGNLGVPILLVQHMPPVFTASLASNLNKKCALTVKEAEDKEQVMANTVYIAPGGRHMTVKRNKDLEVHIVLTDDAPEHSCRPAVDVLFRSIADVYNKNILSVILTGMGSDGALGVKALKQAGCYSLTQSEKSCVVYGMPQAVVKLQLSDEAVDIDAMAARITFAVQKR